MFSIAAINDTVSKGQWEPLAPTNEAQEFHLSQTYHEGLRKLQAKEYVKAQELLEGVLKDPILSSVQADVSASDGHLLQLRFLAFKNLATAFLQQGSTYHESALSCYLQAVEIDSKDSVVWNQLGTLSCSMGLLSISRWAFEQGLVCSPNNWNCMEKLLEVLIAIGDEIACLSVAELIWRHWPSHARALHVKNTIEESEPIPFTPRGIDKLEPKHVRLKFLDKRKASNDDLDEGVAAKKLNQNLDMHLAEATWTALAGELLEILLPSNGCGSKLVAEESYRKDKRLIIHLPQSPENIMGFAERRGSTVTLNNENMSHTDCNSEKGDSCRVKEASMYEEQPQERHSTHLERRRSHQPDKEELDFSTSKDLAKVVIQSFEPFVMGGSGTNSFTGDTSCAFPCADVVANPLDNESDVVTKFAQKASKNYGAYHVAHLLLEEVSCRGILYQDAFTKFLELEKLTRHWGGDRKPECSLFLAELYYDFGCRSSDSSMLSDLMSEASYHLCKVIESVALEHPLLVRGLSMDEHCSSTDSSESSSQLGSLLSSKSSFWVRFFWLSGQLSILDGDKAKAQKEFGISLSLLTEKKNVNNSLGYVSLPHNKVTKKLTVDRVLHEINLLEVDFVLKSTVDEMLEKDMYLECVSLLASLLFATKDVHMGVSCIQRKEGEGITKVELGALDVLIKACEEVKPIDVEVNLNDPRWKLQILMGEDGLEVSPCLSKLSFQDVRNKVGHCFRRIKRKLKEAVESLGC